MYEEEDAFLGILWKLLVMQDILFVFAVGPRNQVTEVMVVRLASLHLQSRDRCRWFETV